MKRTPEPNNFVMIDLEYLEDENDEEVATQDSNEVARHVHSLTQRPAE